MTELKIVKDDIAEKLDELADLGVCWAKSREAGRMPSGVRAGMIQLAQEVDAIFKAEHKKSEHLYQIKE